MAAGAKDVSMPTYAEAKADLDAALVHQAERIDTDHEELLRALGVR